MEKQIVFNHVPVFDRGKFIKACHSIGDLDAVEDQVKRGICRCYSVNGNGFNIDCVIRGEDSELVLVMVAGSGLKRFIPKFADHAKKSLFKTVRFHTKKCGIKKITELAGFKVVNAWAVSGGEKVYRVIL